MRVEVVDQHLDPFVELVDLLGHAQRQAGLCCKVLGEVGVGQVLLPQAGGGGRLNREGRRQLGQIQYRDEALGRGLQTRTKLSSELRYRLRIGDVGAA